LPTSWRYPAIASFLISVPGSPAFSARDRDTAETRLEWIAVNELRKSMTRPNSFPICMRSPSSMYTVSGRMRSARYFSKWVEVEMNQKNSLSAMERNASTCSGTKTVPEPDRIVLMILFVCDRTSSPLFIRMEMRSARCMIKLPSPTRDPPDMRPSPWFQWV